MVELSRLSHVQPMKSSQQPFLVEATAARKELGVLSVIFIKYFYDCHLCFIHDLSTSSHMHYTLTHTFGCGGGMLTSFRTCSYRWKAHMEINSQMAHRLWTNVRITVKISFQTVSICQWRYNHRWIPLMVPKILYLTHDMWDLQMREIKNTEFFTGSGTVLKHIQIYSNYVKLADICVFINSHYPSTKWFSNFLQNGCASHWYMILFSYKKH